MDSSRTPQQDEQTVNNLDFNPILTSCESEIKDGISANFDPMPQPDPSQDNSVYNFNAILDGLLD
ncbi:hypothetical protein [Halotia branconii]|uniref:Uncharacterized protein n=1 Tax=Halotia branconii CENA392 TaxID=1539056 RepID=A0AAJ6NS99_9CYAN|nr:hypothetical protein [Halotia branconii]WGV25682.1 hypothetical protein QI031_28845 [Halotia branconii CENA392]